MENKLTHEELTQRLNWTLKQKIDHFYGTIDVFYHRMNGQVYEAFSGGRDSTVMDFLIKKWLKMAGLPPIRKVFNNTTNEHQEILDFVEEFGSEVTWIRPKITFAQSLLKYGYPVISKEQAMAISRYRNTKSEEVKKFRLTGDRGDGIKRTVGVISKKWHYVISAPFKVTERCCDLLKKEPVKRFEKETGLRPIVGTMTEESSIRKRQYIKNGCIVWDKGNESCRPLSIFTDRDINELIRIYKIKICPIYYDQIIDGELVKGEERTGCAYCAYGCHYEAPDDNRFIRLSKREPKRFASMMDKLGYRSVLNFMGIKIPESNPQPPTK